MFDTAPWIEIAKSFGVPTALAAVLLWMFFVGARACWRDLIIPGRDLVFAGLKRFANHLDYVEQYMRTTDERGQRLEERLPLTCRVPPLPGPTAAAAPRQDPPAIGKPVTA